MASTGGSTAVRVRSRDGTEIGYFTTGDGPPLLLVHGTSADHSRWRPLLPFLEPHARVHALDRRGRGASGDAMEYALEREFEDVAAVIDAIAEASGSAVDVYGHSYGGLCSLGAATLTSNIGRLVVYEPPVSGDPSLPEDFPETLDSLVAAGKREAAVEVLFRDVLGMSEDDLKFFRAQPAWQARIAAAHTIGREFRAEIEAAIDPERFRTITVPTLMLAGSESPAFLQADTETVSGVLPDVRLVLIEGQEHAADVMVPETFAGHVVDFLRR